MRIVSYRFVPVIIIFSLLFLVSACQDDPIRPESIDYNSPSIVSVNSDVESPAPGDSVRFSVVTEGEVSSYTWTADSGSFSDASANPTYWIAPGAAGFYNVTCKVGNSSGSRSSTTTMQVKEEAAGMGDGYWPFDLDFKDNSGTNHGQGDATISISNDEFVGGIGSALFEGEDEVVNGQLFAGSALKMGTNDDFTVILWIKTTDDEGFLFGKTSEEDGAYLQGASCIWIGEGNVNIDIAWVDGAGGGIPVNDGEWHHVAWTKTGLASATYIDGVKDIDSEFGDWSDDAGFQITMGAAWEEAGAEWWPFNYQGYMDEVQFFQEYFTAEEIIAMYTDQKAHWTFDADFKDVLGSNHGEGDETISISTDEFIEGTGSVLFESEDETQAGQLLAGTDLGMGPDDDFTVTLWLKTTDDEGFLFGKSSAEGLYVQGGNSIWLAEGNVNFDLSWVDGAGGSIAVNDGEWHHVAYRKSGLMIATFIDGVQDIDTELGEWSDDTDFQITMGAAWEEPPDEWWPGNFQGYMDDVRFFQRAIPASSINAIYEENKP
jgi:PKD repeat protein